MASITATHLDAPKDRSGRRLRVRAAAAVRAVRHAAQTVSTARPSLSPVLTVTGLGSIDIAVWTTFGRGAAWLALGASILIFDWSRD